MGFLLQGIWIVFTNRELRREIWRPLLQSVLLSIGVVIVVAILLGSFLNSRMPQNFSGPLGFILGTIAAVLLFQPVFFLGSVMLSANRWASISLKVEDQVTRGPIPMDKLSRGQIIQDMVFRLVSGFTFAIISLVIGTIFTPWVGMIFASFAATFDVAGPAYARRGKIFPGHVMQEITSRGYLSFWAGCWLLSLIPIVNLLALPGMVAGATILVAHSERKPT